MDVQLQDEILEQRRGKDRYKPAVLSDEDIVQAMKIQEYKQSMESRSGSTEGMMKKLEEKFSLEDYMKYRRWLSDGKPQPQKKTVEESGMSAEEISQLTEKTASEPEDMPQEQQKEAEEEGREETEQEVLQEQEQPQEQPQGQEQPQEQPEKDFSSMGKGEGDLAYHEYTGRGPKAKHASRMYNELTYAKDDRERALQEAVISKIVGEYEIEIEHMEEKRADEKRQKHELKEAHRKEYERLNTIDKTMNQMDEQAQQNETASGEQREQISNLRMEHQAVSKMKQDSIEELTQIIPQEENLQNEVVSLAAQISAAFNIIAELETGDPGFLACRKIGYYKARIASWTKKAHEKDEKLQENKEKREALTEKVRECESRLSDISRAIDEITKSLASSESAAAAYREQHKAMAEEYGQELKNTEWFQQIKGIQKESRQSSEEIEKLRAKQSGAENEVLSSDVIHVATENFKATENGIYIDGKLYLGNGDIYEENEENSLTGSYEKKDMEIQIEEQKIVRALRQKEIFRYINSDNLMEYMTYDENEGNFDLPEEIDPSMQQKQMLDMLNAIDDRMKAMNMESKLAEAVSSVIGGGNYEPGKMMQSLLQEAMRIEATENAKMSDDAENFDSMGQFRLLGAGIGNGFVNIFKWLWQKSVGGVKDYVGVSSGKNVKNAKATGDESLSGCAPIQFFNTVTAALGPTLLLVDTLCKDALLNAGLVLEKDALLGTLKASEIYDKLPNVDVFGKSSLSSVGGLSAGLAMGKDIASSELSRHEKNQLREGAAKKEQKGQSRYGKALRDAATKKKSDQVDAYIDLAKDSASLAFALSGIGGIGVTGILLVSGIVAKIISSKIIWGKRKEEVLNSPEVLGGISYNNKLIDKKHFNALLADVTGLNDTDSLFEAMRITDGIDLHRAAKASLVRPNPDIDEAMFQLGFQDKSKFQNIRLGDIHKKLGYNDDWKTGLRNAIEIKGLDYNTSWSKFVRGFNKDHYKEKESIQRYSREDIAKRRREEGDKAFKKKEERGRKWKNFKNMFSWN